MVETEAERPRPEHTIAGRLALLRYLRRVCGAINPLKLIELRTRFRRGEFD